MHISDRRGFLVDSGIAGAALIFLGPTLLRQMAWARSASYTGATYFTPEYRALRHGIDGFVSRLRERAGGDFKVDFFDSGTLMDADAQLLGLRAGSIQFVFHTSTYLTSAIPVLGIMGLPGICEQLYTHGERLAMQSPLWKLINERLAKHNLFLLTAGGGTFEPEYIWTGHKSIASLSDLQGLRARIVSEEAEELLKVFGVTGVRISSSQTYLALQRGTVDIVVANVSTVIARNLYRRLDSCFKLPVTAYTIDLLFLKDRWDRLPPKHKAIFWDAALWYDKNSAHVANTKIYPQEQWPRLKRAGIKIIEPSADDLQKLNESAQRVWDWWKERVGTDVGQEAIDLALGRG